MTAISLNVTQSSYPWASLSPIPLVEGDKVSFNFNCAYASSIANDGNLDCQIYQNGKVKTGLLTGSVTATGTDNNIVSKVTTGLVQGEYVIAVFGTVDGLVRCAAKVLLQVQGKGISQ